jgi:hypothetical protein
VPADSTYDCQLVLAETSVGRRFLGSSLTLTTVPIIGLCKIDHLSEIAVEVAEGPLVAKSKSRKRITVTPLITPHAQALPFWIGFFP